MRLLYQKKEGVQSHGPIDAASVPAATAHPSAQIASVAVDAKSAVAIASPAAETVNVKGSQQDLAANPGRADPDANVVRATKAVAAEKTVLIAVAEVEEEAEAMRVGRGAVIQRIRPVETRRGDDRIVLRGRK
jgi:hypothetical protein